MSGECWLNESRVGGVCECKKLCVWVWVWVWGRERESNWTSGVCLPLWEKSRWCVWVQEIVCVWESKRERERVKRERASGQDRRVGGVCERKRKYVWKRPTRHTCYGPWAQPLSFLGEAGNFDSNFLLPDRLQCQSSYGGWKVWLKKNLGSFSSRAGLNLNNSSR